MTNPEHHSLVKCIGNTTLVKHMAVLLDQRAGL